MVDDTYPRCVTCHGQHDVAPASRELYAGTAERHCGECHEPGTDVGEQVDDIYQALKGADDAFEQAEAIIAVATERRLLMGPQEEQLQRGKTPLIESRAMQHTANVEEIQAKAGESLEISQQAQQSVEEALKGLETRRIGMIVAVGVILITVAALILIKLELDRDLEAERARRRNQMASSHE